MGLFYVIIQDMIIDLQRCKRTDPKYQEIRDRHYVPNKGTHGQQLHYLVLVDGEVVGIISGASCVYAVKSRDDYFGLNKDNKKVALPSIINNVVFRLERHDIPNLATQVLSLWRKRVSVDWEERYKVKVHGFETFVVEEDYRKGTLYKADNWDFCGYTSGNTKVHSHGLGNKGERVSATIKMIYCKKISKTSLSTSYTPTWNLKKEKRI
jgi:hypothetical protein